MNDHAIPSAETSITAFVGRVGAGPKDVATTVRSWAEFEASFGPLDRAAPLTGAVHAFFDNGGETAVVVRSGKSGLNALDSVASFNLLVLAADSENGDVPNAQWGEALACCVTRRAMLLIDPPEGWRQASDVISGLASLGIEGTAARNAALYFPRVQTAEGTLAPGGFVAGIMARTDRNRGVWKAPAGLEATIQGAVGLDVPIEDPDNGALNSRGVNCLRTFPGLGTVVWGARTARGADVLSDDFKYIPVRRLSLFLEESLDRGLRWAVDEPNDVRLWTEIRTVTFNFLFDLFRAGALAGAKADEAFFVTCDSTTTSQADIDAGIVNIEIGFAPLKPAEFVLVRIQQLAARPDDD
jgi:phage tail sheath protein FI